MSLVSRIGVPVLTLSSNERGLIKLGQRRIDSYGDTNKFMLVFKESIVRIFPQWRKDIESCAHMH